MCSLQLLCKHSWVYALNAFRLQEPPKPCLALRH